MNITSTESYDVQERVIKATAMVGLVQLSTNLLESMISDDNYNLTHDQNSLQQNKNEKQINMAHIPSGMAYSSVLNSLRKMGKISKMRNLLDKLVIACKKQNVHLDLVTFNIYLSGLCDAILTSNKHTVDQSPINDDNDDDVDHDVDVDHGDNTTKNKYQKQTNDFLSEVVYLLQPGVAEEKFFLNNEPNILSYNTVLSVAARLGDQTIVNEVYDLLRSRDIQPDIYTYNARIRSAKYNSIDSLYPEVLNLFDELMSEPNIKPDQYTIELVLVPLARAGRVGDILNLIRDFEISEGSNHRGLQKLSNAFSTFLITLVKADEIEIAQAIFETFIITKGNTLTTMKNDVFKGVRNEKRGSQVSTPPITRHFNVLIEGYRSIHDVNKFKRYKSVIGSERITSVDTSKVSSSAAERAMDLYHLMQDSGIPLDAYTITSILGVTQTSEEVISIWEHIQSDNNIQFTSVIYNAIITAFGNVHDPSSACYIFDMMLNDKKVGNTRNSWNVLLISLSKSSSIDSTFLLDTRSSNVTSKETEDFDFEKSVIGSIVNGQTVADATLQILDVMRNPKKYDNISARLKNVPLPTSQSYCVVASALSRRDISMKEDDIRQFFQNALNDGVTADGRFLNALIRCYGDQIEDAIKFWKSGVRQSVLSHEMRRNRPSSRNSDRIRKKGKNLMAAYHGLFHVAGRAERPDIALRLVYAMNKEGIEPTETTLNSYKNGKRARASMKTNKSQNFFLGRLTNQYESLLTIECTKYDQKDQRRQNEKRVRIII